MHEFSFVCFYLSNAEQLINDCPAASGEYQFLYCPWFQRASNYWRRVELVEFVNQLIHSPW